MPGMSWTSGRVMDYGPVKEASADVEDWTINIVTFKDRLILVLVFAGLHGLVMYFVSIFSRRLLFLHGRYLAVIMVQTCVLWIVFGYSTKLNCRIPFRIND